MKAGAEPKKIAILAALLIVAAIILYFNVFSGDSVPNRPVSTPAPGVIAGVTAPAGAAPGIATPGSAGPRAERRRASKNGVISEFKIRQGVEAGQDKPDPATIDPTLRLDLLAKLQSVEPPASMRNIFQYGPAPPPPAPAKPVELPKNTAKIPINQPPATAGPPLPPPAPTAPPMTFKYYGYKVSKSDGRKVAFLLDGEDIIIAGESDAVKSGRYKVVRIGVNSITMEDTQFKSTQTLPLQEDAVV
jgi:hypothetical protein